MNDFFLNRVAQTCFWRVAFVFFAVVINSRASEYEVEGKIHQVITEANGYREEGAADFIVSVRDCGWLIQLDVKDNKGKPFREEIGSTNGTEIFDLVGDTAIIISNNVPVGFLDRSMGGHLWLMYASQCYWGTLKSDMVTPVFDWKACAGANPDLKVSAQWQLLNGPWSLPREVDYLGQWDETNGLYTVIGTTIAGQTMVPKSFVFEERYAVAMKGMVLRKRVEAEVSTIRASCSKANLLPAPNSKTIDVDFRLVTDRNAVHLPTYRNPADGKWASVEEARKIAPPIATSNFPARPSETNPHRRLIVLIFLCSSTLLGPLIMFWSWRKGKKGKA